MARTRAIIEKDIEATQQEITSYVTKKGLKATDKKLLRTDPQWRRLVAIVEKYKKQLVGIEKRNRKGTVAAQG